MARDPYQVLGVAESATSEEIKKAYRRKAREYHPDLHPNDPATAQKMKEVNEAYDLLTNPQKQTQRQNTSGSTQNAYCGYSQQRHNNAYQGAGGWSSDFNGFDFADFFGFGFDRQDTRQTSTRPVEEPGDSRDVRYVVSAINAGRFRDAIQALLLIPGTGRDSRWHYLLSLAYYGEGSRSRAIDEMQRAVREEPNNRLYASLLRQFIGEERAAEPQPEHGFRMPSFSLGKAVAGIVLAHMFFTFFQMLMFTMRF